MANWVASLLLFGGLALFSELVYDLLAEQPDRTFSSLERDCIEIDL